MAAGKGKAGLRILLIVSAVVGLSLAAVALYSRLLTPGSVSNDAETLPPLMLEERDVFISAITGEVFIIRNDINIPASVGDVLREGDVLKVVDQSYCQLQFSDRGAAGLESNTVMLMKKLVNAGNMQVRTEVLMGSMLYRVNRVQNQDLFQVEAQGVLYDVKGTEFLVALDERGRILAVTEGAVQVSGDSFEPVLVNPGQEMIIPAATAGQPSPTGLTPSTALLLNNIPLIEPVAVGEQTSHRLILEVEPAGTAVYINGVYSGTGSLSFVTEGNREYTFLLRKRGYQDTTLRHTTRGDITDERLFVKLEPAALNPTLEQDASEYLSSYGKLLEEQIQVSRAERDLLLREAQEGRARQEQLLVELQGRNEGLEQQLKAKDEEIEKLRALMTQISELSGGE